MPEENTLNNLPQEEAPPPPVDTPVEATAPETAVTEEKTVDETPNPEVLKSQIEQLKNQRKEAEEKALYWRKQKAEARAEYFRGDRVPESKPTLPPEVPGIGPEPKPSDFEDYDKYVAALTDHRVRKARVEWEMDTARKEQERNARQRSENLQTKLQEGYQKYPDFEEVAFDRSASHITPMIVDILADCEHPADLAYYLAKNRVEGISISRMTPIQAARAIAKLEAKLEGQPPQTPTPPPQRKPTTGAPPPINPVGAGKSGIQRDPEKMTQKEYEQWRLSQGARKF
jgi:hypothetical protein